MTTGVERRRASRQPRQGLADLRQEQAALALALARLSEAAQSDMTKAMLQAASRLDMRAAPVPVFMQAGQSPPT